MAFEMNRIIFMALPFCVVGLSSPVEAEAVKETVKANSQFALDPAATDDGPKAEVKVPAENVAVPKQMALAWALIACGRPPAKACCST